MARNEAMIQTGDLGYKLQLVLWAQTTWTIETDFNIALELGTSFPQCVLRSVNVVFQHHPTQNQSWNAPLLTERSLFLYFAILS